MTATQPRSLRDLVEEAWIDLRDLPSLVGGLEWLKVRTGASNATD